MLAYGGGVDRKEIMSDNNIILKINTTKELTDLDSCTDPDPHRFVIGSRMGTILYYLPDAYIKDPD